MADTNMNKNELNVNVKSRANKNKIRAKGDVKSTNNQIHIENLFNGISKEEVKEEINKTLKEIKVDERINKLESGKILSKTPNAEAFAFSDTINILNGEPRANWAREMYSRAAHALTEEDLKYIFALGTIYTATYLSSKNINIESNATIKNILNNKDMINKWFSGIKDYEYWFNKCSDTIAFQKLRHFGFYTYSPSNKGFAFDTSSNEMNKLYNNFPVFEGIKNCGEGTMIVNDLLHLEAIYWILISLNVTTNIRKTA